MIPSWGIVWIYFVFSAKIVIFAHMLRIIAHIERLLVVQDCVILPGVGGFVRQTVPAAYDKDAHTFTPAYKELTFNADLRHADGLLTESYRRVYGLDYAEAQHFLEQDVEALRSELRAERKVSLGYLGKLMLGDEEQLIFLPGDEAWLNADMYGLKPFTWKPLPAQSTLSAEEAPSTEKEVYYIPVTRRVLQGIAGAAAAIALFFLSSTPVVEVNPTAYTASFVPTEMMRTMVDAAAPLEGADVEGDAAELSAESVLTVAEPVVAQPVPAQPKPIKAEALVEKPTAQKMYHLVIASFPTKTQADEFMTGVDKQRYQQANVILRNGKYRVYAERYDNRAEAERRLTLLRQTACYKDAWLFISK